MSSSEPGQSGPLIRRFRLASGLSQEQLAERSGLSARAVSDLERGLRIRPRPETLRMLADGLSLSGEDREILLLAARPELREPVPATPPPLPLGSRWPAPRSLLIGREQEVAEVGDLLQRDARLVTLTGPGGVGKTRVALEAGRVAAQSAGWEAYFIDLSSATGLDQVGSAISLALGLWDASNRSREQSIAQALQNRRVLLLLDNFEQAMAAASLVNSLLEDAPELRLLVTSREALRIQDEIEVAIDPLGLPGTQDEVSGDDLRSFAAVALFVERARSADVDFVLTPENEQSIVEICRRLDGLPLAIELAASRVRHFPPELIVQRMERLLPVLTGGSRDSPSRQRTLRDTIAWSYDLLTLEEQALFRRVGAFPAGATLEALDCFAREAGAIQIELLGGLASLCDRHLVIETKGASGDPRFSMLETIREFADEMIASEGELELFQRAVVAWALDIIAKGRSGIYGWFIGPTSTLEMDEQFENFRLAFEIAAIRRDAGVLAQLLIGTGGYFFQRGIFREALNWGKQAIDLARTGAISERLLGMLLVEYATFYLMCFDAADVEELAREGLLHVQAGAGDEADLVQALNGLSMTIREQGRYTEALDYSKQADILAQTPTGAPYKALTTFSLGKLSYFLGDQERAVDYLSQSMSKSLQSDAIEFAVHAGCYLSVAQLRHDQPTAAAATLREVVDFWRETESSGAIPFLNEAAILAATRDLPELAGRLFAADFAQNARFGIRDENDRWTIAAIESTKAQLGQEALDAAMVIGRQFSSDDAVALVLDVLGQIEAQESRLAEKTVRGDS